MVLRLCQDVNAFPNFGAFEQAIEQVVGIAKQNEGWLRSQRQGHGQSREAGRARARNSAHIQNGPILIPIWSA